MKTIISVAIESRQHKVTAHILNVRSEPGVAGEIIDRLTQGSIVESLLTKVVNMATWHMIGEDRWVHGGWLTPLTSQPHNHEFVFVSNTLPTITIRTED